MDNTSTADLPLRRSSPSSPRPAELKDSEIWGLENFRDFRPMFDEAALRERNRQVVADAARRQLGLPPAERVA